MKNKGFIPFILSILIFIFAAIIGIRTLTKHNLFYENASFGRGLTLSMPVNVTDNRGVQVRFQGNLSGGKWTFSVVSPDNKVVYSNSDNNININKVFHDKPGIWQLKLYSPKGENGRYVLAARAR